MDQPKYPIGIETFSDIIQGGYVYVDKTEIIYNLISSGKFFFLSRPRRFGKSLMISTIQAYFEGRRELFEGLWLGQADGIDWTPRPVLRFNFANAQCTIEGLSNVLDNHLLGWETKYGLKDCRFDYAQRFLNVIAKAHEVTGKKVVVLIDEYDKPLLNSLHDCELHEQLKNTLKSVYGTLKAADRFIHFAMLTGVSRFSKLSIFSDLNNLRDISLSNSFSAICGITQEELINVFKDGIKTFSQKENVDFDRMVQILKDNYDGYHFSSECVDVYNPFSLINAFADNAITHKWFESGTPTFLLKKIRDTDEDIRDILSQEVSTTTLSNTSISDTNLISILYQTGYLTIKSYDKEEDSFLLGIPNREVEVGMLGGLLPLYTGKDEVANDNMLIKLRRAIRSGEVNKFMEILKIYLAGIPYGLSNGKPEIYYENNLYLIFRMLGFDAQVETQTSEGRIDVVLKTSDRIYIIELKLDESAKDALSQIKEKQYDLPFSTDKRAVVCIGVNFSKKTRTIESWLVG